MKVPTPASPGDRLLMSRERRLIGCDVAIFMAVPEESVEVRRRIAPSLQGGDGRLHGVWRGRSVRLQETGPGMARAEDAARRLFAATPVRLAICAGLAGGLDPVLPRHAITVADRVIDEAGTCEVACDHRSVEVAVACGAQRASLLTVPRVVCTVDEKRALATRASMVDMESLSVARVAREHGVPFVSLRVISDGAHDGFPVDLNRYLDARGDVRRLALVLAALARPGGLRFLLGLRATALKASSDLASLLERVIDTVSLDA
ncbi:MAG: hypothetical protein EB084_04555 [Proteobacteria bacterium]|nr:hypothetical protein [Pseudomonadota bacterium]